MTHMHEFNRQTRILHRLAPFNYTPKSPHLVYGSMLVYYKMVIKMEQENHPVLMLITDGLQ